MAPSAARAFVSARGGTLLIDEIGELPLDLQPRLLRALERREVQPLGSDSFVRTNVRVISATHRDLSALVESGRFRQDLLQLAAHFSTWWNGSRPWRRVRSWRRRTSCWARCARAPRPVGPALEAAVSSTEAVAIRRALEQAAANKSEAARLLGIARKTLREKMKKLGLEAPDR